MPMVENLVLEEDYVNRLKAWLDVRVAKGKESIALVLRQAWTLTLLLKHPRTPWASRVVAGCTVSYLLSPVQLIPTFVPVIGQLDDLFVLFIGMKLIRRLTPGEILTECERQAESSILPKHMAGDKPGLPAKGPARPPAE